MQRSATRERFLRTYSSEDLTDLTERPESFPGSERLISGEGSGDGGVVTVVRNGPKRWSVVLLSALCSAVAVASAGCFCALVYPILKELRAERVKAEDGTEHRMLGFWSILVLSLIAGFICTVFSWTLTYIDSRKPGTASLLTLAHFRDVYGQSFHMGYGVAVLNGIMAVLTVVWSLT